MYEYITTEIRYEIIVYEQDCTEQSYVNLNFFHHVIYTLLLKLI